jgi:hypothetical protein
MNPMSRDKVRLGDSKIPISGAARQCHGLRRMEALCPGMALPKSAECGNLSLNKAIIWWISVNITARAEEYYGCIVPSAILS